MLNLLTLLVINFLGIIVTILVIMIAAAVLIGIVWLFEKYVLGKPVDPKIKGIFIFILLALLIIYAITNGGIIIKV